MNLKELGGEIAFIQRISREPSAREIKIGIGDDCAVVEIDPSRLHLYTTDMLIDGDHFSTAYFEPYDIGAKAMESNVSDIAAMGGKVLYALVSLSIPEQITVSFLDECYRGMYDVAARYSFDIVGGDTTHGKTLVINVTLVGETTPTLLKLRSAAEPGDLIAVSGPLGGSTAGLRLFQKAIKGYSEIKRYHTSPKCSMNQLNEIICVAKAMEDVSDGLASEVRNICKNSGVGAQLFKEKIPLCTGIRETAALLGDDPFDYALFGGEDFKLVYTLSPANKGKVVGTVVGEITDGANVFLDDKKLVHFGYDHFS
ncbi:MAG: thiamine-phosphate kinase [Pseudomonadota bacterium]